VVTDQPARRWLNRTVVGIGLASLCSDWSHEIATTVLPAFLATMGAAAAWLGFIEGTADGLASFAKLVCGFYSDRLPRRKPLAVAGYILTALGTASLGFAASAWQVLAARSTAWLGRGVRTPVRKALLAAAVTREAYGRAFGFERMLDTLGAIIGPITALVVTALLLRHFHPDGDTGAGGGLHGAVQERGRRSPCESRPACALPLRFRRLLVAVGLFGLGDFPSLLILLAVSGDAAYGAATAVAAATDCSPHSAVRARWSRAGRRPHEKGPTALGTSLAPWRWRLCYCRPAWTLALIFVLGGVSVAVCETRRTLLRRARDDTRHGMTSRRHGEWHRRFCEA
jgi:hypothetical protein